MPILGKFDVFGLARLNQLWYLEHQLTVLTEAPLIFSCPGDNFLNKTSARETSLFLSFPSVIMSSENPSDPENKQSAAPQETQEANDAVQMSMMLQTLLESMVRLFLSYCRYLGACFQQNDSNAIFLSKLRFQVFQVWDDVPTNPRKEYAWNFPICSPPKNFHSLILTNMHSSWSNGPKNRWARGTNATEDEDSPKCENPTPNWVKWLFVSLLLLQSKQIAKCTIVFYLITTQFAFLTNLKGSRKMDIWTRATASVESQNLKNLTFSKILLAEHSSKHNNPPVVEADPRSASPAWAQ